MREAGMRVLAVRDATATEVNIYGYGKYVGDEPCPIMGGIPNPKIALDSGEVVWGCECWWGAAEAAEQKLQIQTGGRKVNTVPVESGATAAALGDRGGCEE